MKKFGITAAAPLLVPIPASSCTPIAHSVPAPPPLNTYIGTASTCSRSATSPSVDGGALPRNSKLNTTTYDTYVRATGFSGHGGDIGHGGVDVQRFEGENKNMRDGVFEHSSSRSDDVEGIELGMKGIVEEQIAVWEDRVKGSIVSDMKSFYKKIFDMPTLTTTNSHATTTTTNNNDNRRRGRSSTPKRRVDEQHDDDRRRDASHEQRRATTTTTTTTTTTGLCEKIACVAGKPDPFSKVKAQDFLAYAGPSARASWSCPPDDSSPPGESQIGEACRDKAHEDTTV